jgi:ankyrin repeat protein
MIDELKEVALHSQNMKRRMDAAFEYSMHVLDEVQICQQTRATINEALYLLLKAATHDVADSRNVVGWYFTAFGKSLPVAQELEAGWLFTGTMAGSEIARRRLKDLNLPDHTYINAVYRLRSERGGNGFRIEGFGDALYIADTLDQLDTYEKYMPDVVQSTLHFIAMTGNHFALTKLLSLRPSLDLNIPGDDNTTALMRACMAGHEKVAMQLLSRGADPTIAVVGGTTPLHFLSSFDDEIIPAVAHGLVKAGASLEARASAVKYMPQADSYLRTTKGTPLTFAVTSNSLVAAQTLAERGADPFDILGEGVELGDEFVDMIHHSPVLHAVKYHQHDILRVLLARADKATLEKYLAPRRIPIGPGRSTFHTRSYLQWLVDCKVQGLRRRISKHGAQFREAFMEAFEILIQYGANPLDADGHGSSLVELAVPHGQPFIIDFLMGWQDARLMSNPSNWLRCLIRAVAAGDIIVFDTLMGYQRIKEVESADLWFDYFRAVCQFSNETHFLEPFESKLGPDFDGTDLLWAAMEGGHFSVARWIHKLTKCDLNRKHDDKTLLGHLLLWSKKHARRRRAVEVLLQLDSVSDDIFYNVTTISDSPLTALQAAAYFPEYDGAASMAGTILQVIFERWDAPEFLNYQVPNGYFQGSTALHLAIRTANRLGVEYLLDEALDDLDLSILDSSGYNVYDRAIINLSNQATIMEIMQLPTSFHEQADMNHWIRSMKIISIIDKHAPRPNRIIRAYARPEIDTNAFLSFDPKLKIEQFKVPGMFGSFLSEK